MKIYVCEVYDHKTEKAVCRGIDMEECAGDAYDMCMKTINKLPDEKYTYEAVPGDMRTIDRYEFFCTEDSIDFQWRMDEEGYRKFRHDTDPRDCEDWCGSVYFGKYSLEFIHITDNCRYYNLFVLGQKGYATLIDGTPYLDVVWGDDLPIPNRRSLENFQKEIQAEILDMLRKHPDMITDATSATEPEKWFPKADGTYYKPTITRRA